MKKKDLIFLGGIHGVGKSVFCERISEKTLYSHQIASQLIKNKSCVSMPPPGKEVSDVMGNQQLLIDAINDCEETKLLLDGHYTLRMEKGEIYKIDPQVFKSLSPRLLIIFYDDPTKIAERVKKRDGEIQEISKIDHFQKLEMEHANFISSVLGVPIFKLRPQDSSSETVLIDLMKESVL